MKFSIAGFFLVGWGVYMVWNTMKAASQKPSSGNSGKEIIPPVTPERNSNGNSKPFGKEDWTFPPQVTTEDGRKSYFT